MKRVRDYLNCEIEICVIQAFGCSGKVVAGTINGKDVTSNNNIFLSATPTATDVENALNDYGITFSAFICLRRVMHNVVGIPYTQLAICE